MTYGYYNGEYAPIDELKIPALDRAVYFGDGVYDVTTLVNGKFYALDDHIERFYNSCRMLDIDYDLKPEQLVDVFNKLAELSKPEGDALLYWQASRCTGMRLHSYSDGVSPNTFAYCKSIKRTDPYEKIALITEEDIRARMCNIKTLNLIPNVRASKKAADAGCFEAVLCRDGMVTEGSHTSVMLINNGALVARPLSELILPSVTRKRVLEFCEQLGIPTEIREFSVEEMFAAEEVLVGSATTLVRRASKIDGKDVGGRGDKVFLPLAEHFLKDYTGQ